MKTVVYSRLTVCDILHEYILGDIAEAGTRVNFVTMPDFLNGVGEALKVIIEVGNRMQGICRRAKKDMKRKGSAFWAKLDEWNAMRSSI